MKPGAKVFTGCLVAPKLGIGVPVRVGKPVPWFTDDPLIPGRRRPPTGVADVTTFDRQHVQTRDAKYLRREVPPNRGQWLPSLVTLG